MEPSGFPFQPERALGPARMGLAFGATVARMVLQCRATLLDVALNFPVDTDLPAAFAIKIDFAEPSTEGGGQVAPGSSILRVEVLADLHPASDRGRCGDVGEREPPHVAFLGEHQRSGRLMIMTNARVDDHRPALILATWNPDDVARLQDRQRLQRFRATVRTPPARGGRLEVGDLGTQARVLAEVAKLALRCRPLGSDILLVLGQGARRTDHRAVGLELRERLLEQRTGTLPPDACNEIDRHVVGRGEGGPERIGTP